MNSLNQKMRIMMVVGDLCSESNPSFQPFVRSQIESVADLGHDVEIFNIQGPDAWYHYATKGSKLYRRAREFEPHVVHSHYSYCAFTAMISLPHPQVISFMGDDVLGDFTMNGARTLRSYLHLPVAWIPQLFARQIIVKSAEMVPYIRHPNVHVVPNGIDYDTFYPMEKETARRDIGLDGDANYIIFPGDIHDERKRFALAREACAILRERYGIDNEILHMRTRPQRELNRYFNASDVMVFTSWSEGSPNVIKEAMATNLPIVSVPVGDVEDVIGGTRGCYVVNDDPEAIAAHLAQALKTKERTNGRHDIQWLRIENVAKRLETIYRAAIQ